MATIQLQEKYAELALRTGVNLQKGQALMINAPLEGADFTKIIARKAYELGAKDVHINWVDDELTLLRYQHAPDEVIGSFPDGGSNFMMSLRKMERQSFIFVRPTLIY